MLRVRPHGRLQLVSRYERDYFAIQNTSQTQYPELGNGPTFGGGPDLPLGVKQHIFDYLDVNEINKMKDVSASFIEFVEFLNLHLSQQIKTRLDDIIIPPLRRQRTRNEHRFLPKNRVRYYRAYNRRRKVVSGMGYIVKVTPTKVSILLEGDIFTSQIPPPIKMENKYVSHVGPYVGDNVFHVANYNLVNRHSRELKPMNCYFNHLEMACIDKCRIKINDNFGIYSDMDMSRAISILQQEAGEHIEVDVQNASPLYQKCRVKVKCHREFFKREIYEVLGWHAYDYKFYEEDILLEIETLRRSDKATHNFMIRNGMGMVVFGPWYNYAFQRLLQLSSSVGDDNPVSPWEYTAVKIIRSLFSFITDNLKEVVLPGQLEALKTDFGVDWKRNVNTAFQVIIDYGHDDHFLYEEFAKFEAHVMSLS